MSCSAALFCDAIIIRTLKIAIFPAITISTVQIIQCILIIRPLYKIVNIVNFVYYGKTVVVCVMLQLSWWTW